MQRSQRRLEAQHIMRQQRKELALRRNQLLQQLQGVPIGAVVSRRNNYM